MLTAMRVPEVAGRAETLQRNVEVAIRGKPEVVRLALTCLLAEGHLLIEDVPGVGKTSLAQAMAASIDATWHRIQFTPDLLPSDVTGVTIYNQATRQFEFRPGAVFAHLIVADEINRASPKTQSALLEVMQERRVTVDAQGYPVPRPFMVIATQNPVEMDGTYPLPEAQIDRFLMRIQVGYPDKQSELDILRSQGRGPVVDDLRPVVSATEVKDMIAAVAEVFIAPAVLDYLVEVVAATRSFSGVRLGASPRASLALQRAARAWASIEGREYVIPEDVKALAPSVLAHRLVFTPEAELEGRTKLGAIEQVLDSVPVPRTVRDAAANRLA
jgi:MoxR-like ATPase